MAALGHLGHPAVLGWTGPLNHQLQLHRCIIKVSCAWPRWAIWAILPYLAGRGSLYWGPFIGVPILEPTGWCPYTEPLLGFLHLQTRSLGSTYWSRYAGVPIQGPCTGPYTQHGSLDGSVNWGPANGVPTQKSLYWTLHIQVFSFSYWGNHEQAPWRGPRAGIPAAHSTACQHSLRRGCHNVMLR